jgi:N-acylglucosamine 2-epimerase
MDFLRLANQYKTELLEQVIPFWEKFSIDTKHGGFFTCLLPDGKVFDTDKFVWLQARQVWTFSMLYERLSPNAHWLQLALSGADFLLKHGMDKDGNWYFSLDQTGRPLIQPYNIFSDCFAAMAMAQMYRVTKDEKFKEIAFQTWTNILARQSNPKGTYEKAHPGTRPVLNFSLPMILSNLALEMEAVLGKETVNAFAMDCIDLVMDKFYDAPTGLILENITPEGQRADGFKGRVLNPGHAVEAMWFIMDLGVRQNDRELIYTAVDRMLIMIEKGWDDAFGGIFYYLDINGYPPEQLEWNQKLWWVHIECLVGLLKGYALTDNEACIKWFNKIHQYTWSHFRDLNGGEWYGYLDRRGKILVPLKGGKWKGCFHIPRGLYQCYTVLETLNKK